MIIYIIVYLILILSCIGDFSKLNQRNFLLHCIACFMIIFIGFRRESGADSIIYIDLFKYNTDTLWNWEGKEKGYAEYGFYYLSVLLKSIFNNIDFYFTVISCLTISFLIKSLKEFSIYPILGFCVYYSRFLIIRDMNQIRQALAMVIIIYAFKYLLNNKKNIFIWTVILCTFIHYSSIIVLPFIFFYDKIIDNKKITLILLSSAFIGVAGSILIKKILIASGYGIFLSYVNTQNLGILNPVLIYQLFICALFIYFEPILKEKQKGYNIIKNAYLYSTLLLLLTCNLGEVGGRLATIFATCEIFIIPALVNTIKPRIGGYIIYLLLIILLFAMNYYKLSTNPDSWQYIQL